MLIHPLVVHFPVAFWLGSTFFDVLAWRRPDPAYRRMACWLVGLGLIGAAAAIALGWVDFLSVERQGVGTALIVRHNGHQAVAYAATAAYLANFLWRRRPDSTGARLLPLSLLGAALIAATDYLGGAARSVM